MEIKEGYKLTEIGVIPEDWEVSRLGKIAEVGSGGTPDRNNSNYWNGKIPWITTTQVDFKNITEANEYITEKGLKYSSAKFVPSGTILMAMYGQGKTRGKVAMLAIDATTNQACATIITKKEHLNTYTLFYLSSLYEKIRKLSNIGNQENLNGELIKNISVAIPTKREQNAITNALQNVDFLINSLEVLIQKKKQIKQGTMQLLISGKKRLQGFKDEWKIKRLDKIFTFLNTANNSRSELSDDGEVGYIHYGDIHTNWKNFLDCSKAQLPGIALNKVKNIPFLMEGDLILADASEDYEGIGVCVEVRNLKNKKIVAGLHTILLRGNKSYVADGFKGFLRELPGVENALIKIATGISVFGISKTQLKSIEINLPSVEEQEAIAQVLSDMDAEIEQLQRKLSKYKMIKQGMMQNLLTGKIRLV